MIGIRLTYDHVKMEVEKRGGILISTEYVNNHTPLTIECNKCGKIWIPTFNSISNGSWCPICHRDGQKLNNETIKIEVEKRHGTLLSKYVGIKIPLNVKCNKCGEIWHPRFDAIMDGHWCPTCAGRKNTISLVSDKIAELGGILLSTKYIDSNSKLNVRCNMCNKIWHPTYASIVGGFWCPTCAGNKKLDEEFIRKEIESRGGTLMSEKYANSRTKLDIRCNRCGEVWHPVWDKIRSGQWCPNCKGKISKGQAKVADQIKNIFPGHDIVHRFRGFDWLRTDTRNGKQEIDIWVPWLKLAIEYDGKQHFEPVDIFGGQENFVHTQKLDAVKNEKMTQHPEDVRYFIRFNYKEKLTQEYVIEKLRKYGVPF